MTWQFKHIGHGHIFGGMLPRCKIVPDGATTVQQIFTIFSNNVGESRYKSVSSSPLHDRRLLISANPMTRNTHFPLSPYKTCYMCQKVCLSPRRSVPIFRPCPAAAPAGWRHERHSLQQKTSANTRRVAQGNKKRGVCDARRNEQNTCPTCPAWSRGF